jgi:hypothetical protein
MRTKLTFKVYGSNINSIKSDALTQLEKFIGEELTENQRTNIEIEIAELENASETTPMYVGTVYAKL